jgi:hypothetical protein
MKPLSGTLLLGLAFTLAVLAVMPRGTNAGAVALITLICMSIAGLLVKLVQSLRKRRAGK